MADRPADDSWRADVLDRTHVDLAVAGAVLGDGGQRDLIRPTAVKLRWLRSSETAGPGCVPIPRRRLTVLEATSRNAHSLGTGLSDAVRPR